MPDTSRVLRGQRATACRVNAAGREVGQRIEALADWIGMNLPPTIEARRAQASETEAGAAASSTVRRIRR